MVNYALPLDDIRYDDAIPQGGDFLLGKLLPTMFRTTRSSPPTILMIVAPVMISDRRTRLSTPSAREEATGASPRPAFAGEHVLGQTSRGPALLLSPKFWTATTVRLRQRLNPPSLSAVDGRWHY
jgi:hypothetical protein